MKFIDLFSGLGGFHIALAKLGHKCVFACESNTELSDLYKENFKIKPLGDIKKIDTNTIPSHDILCAGFPCQPFSKAGHQKGLKDKERGDFLDDIARILKYHNPKYFILENVPHLRKHDDQRTWEKIYRVLHDECKYDVKEEYLSPHQFGIPQIRKRLFIVGQRNKLRNFCWPVPTTETTEIKRYLNTIHVQKPKNLSKKQLECLNLWQKIIKSINKNTTLPGFPIWSPEFGANYPYVKKATIEYNAKELANYKGSFGVSLSSLSKQQQRKRLPKYATNIDKQFPTWKIHYIKNNRLLYKNNENVLKLFINELKKYPFSWQKFEWNCGNSKRDIFKYIIQFRASGIRVKKTNFIPALVLTSTQIPIIGWEKRYLTIKEAVKLQSLGNIKMPQKESLAFRALGNAVNAHLVYLIATNLIGQKQKRAIHRKKYKKSA